MRVVRDKKVFPSQGQPADSLERLQRTHVYFVAIDYFTKLMEAASFVKLTKANWPISLSKTSPAGMTSVHQNG